MPSLRSGDSAIKIWLHGFDDEEGGKKEVADSPSLKMRIEKRPFRLKGYLRDALLVFFGFKSH